ncbi:class D sortase [Bacillus salipaludis]|uniref:class D sortase n=1 Tax=Bacillus salipaludis TaxID=2547811 RepID=UPI002E1C14F2|nr:class D sortase [Bacillus salipaludis]
MQTKASLKEAKEIVSEQQPIDSNQKPNEKNKYKASEKSKAPKIGDTIGLLSIPKISAELPIVEGTDPDDLAKGVGHYKGSYMPGNLGQIVLSGHRDTVFRHLGELKKGDTLKVNDSKGNFEYEITHMKIVKADDTSIITLQNKQEELILTTCYPFSYVGNAPKRYIIYAKPKS